ncbi:MAG: DUF4838 domain-containing protein [Phycisphaeraceae bacterium]|nr:DUF4838 domain-containing protein [Phycisphaeraceae bacterium]
MRFQCRLLVLLALWGGLQSRLSAAPLTLVDSSQPKAVIVIAPQATRAAQMGAYELQAHVRLITGATLPIVTETPTDKTVRILIGDSPDAAALGIHANDFQSQEHLVRLLPDTVVLIGRDVPNTSKVVYGDNAVGVWTTWPQMWEDRGSLHATYDFLERFCGVRWFNQTDTGTVVTPRTTLTVDGPDIRRASSMKYREVISTNRSPEDYERSTGLWIPHSPGWVVWDAEAFSDLRARYSQTVPFIHARRDRIRLFQLRMREGGERHLCNHSFLGYYDRFWEKNPGKPDLFVRHEPDFFAKGYEGRPDQMCYTSEGFIDQVAADAREYLDGRKTGKELGIFWDPTLPNPFPLEPMDNARYCKCDPCRAIDGKHGNDDNDSGFFSRGNHSDYFFQFVNAVARKVRQTNPDGKLIALAYMTHAAPPEDFNVESNVEVQFCFSSNRMPYVVKEYAHEVRLLRRWAEQDPSRPLSLWLYNGFPVGMAINGKFNCFPGFFAHTIGEQFKLFQQCNVLGIYHCGYGQEVEAYLTYKLMDDWTLDVDTMLDEYFQGLYGKAGEPLKQFYLLVEKTYGDASLYPEKPGHQNMHFAWELLGTAERMKQLGQFVDQARALADTDFHRKNVKVFELGVWEYMKAGREQAVARQMWPIPNVTAPNVPDAGGDVNKVDWSKAGELPGSWFVINSGTPATRKLSGKIAHDDHHLYVELTDPIALDKLETSPGVFPFDTWEMFFARRAALPYRHFAFGPTGLVKAATNGEVNWRMNVPMDSGFVTASTVPNQTDRWTLRVGIPLKDLVENGVKPGDRLHINFARVSNPSLGGGVAAVDSYVGYTGLHQTDRLSLLTLLP